MQLFRLAPRTRAIVFRSLLGSVAVLGVAFIGYVAALDQEIRSKFDGQRWSEPTRVYGRPFSIEPGTRVPTAIGELTRLGYRAVSRATRPGEFSTDAGGIRLLTRSANFAEGARKPLSVSLSTKADVVRSLRIDGGSPLPRLHLDPPPIGSLVPIQGEDRLILQPADVPPILAASLKAVEDRDFDSHGGVDYSAILRAIGANIRAGEIEQGGSTLTQQLVKSYFLDGRRTLGRKLKEAIMARRLEAHYDKREILTAYVNEIYLGQDGARAIHGFGLASQFYFGRTLAELDTAEIATLVGMVRGPSLYDPRRHPKRSFERRNQVLATMLDQRVISREQHVAARDQPLTIAPARLAENRDYFPAYLDLVRRELSTQGYSPSSASNGHSVFTALDPTVQRATERVLARGIDRLEKLRKPRTGQPLEAVIIVALPAEGRVVAVVGGRQASVAGFNRALDARRPIGSLVKPFVYLAALESGHYHAASIVDDAPIVVSTANDEQWQPRNFDQRFNGPVPLVRALAESMNAATVSVALNIGLDPIADTLQAFGLRARPAPVPALALGAVDATPIEVAQLFATLANGGVARPLRAVERVSFSGAIDSVPRQDLAAKDRRVATAGQVQALNQMLVAVMEHGTGRSGRAQLEAGLTVAGKSGTSSGFRDSWFAGFSGRHLIVVWVGTDANNPTGLTGSSGALSLWAAVLRELKTKAWNPSLTPGFEKRWIDIDGGEALESPCYAELIPVLLPSGESLPESQLCWVQPDDHTERDRWEEAPWDVFDRDEQARDPRADRPSWRERIRRWFRDRPRN